MRCGGPVLGRSWYKPPLCTPYRYVFCVTIRPHTMGVVTLSTGCAKVMHYAHNRSPFAGLPICIYRVRNTGDNLPVGKHLSILNAPFSPPFFVKKICFNGFFLTTLTGISLCAG